MSDDPLIPRLRAVIEEIERHCPCGARPESLSTHSHVGGCPVAEALALLAAHEAATPDVVVGGRMERTIADYIRACSVLLVEEQESISSNNALIAVLCDGVRMAREYLTYVAMDLTNHHNALTCPYCNPKGLKLAHEAAAAHEAQQGVEPISRATLERHLDYLRKAMRDMLHLKSDAPDEDIIDIAAGRLAAHEAATPGIGHWLHGASPLGADWHAQDIPAEAATPAADTIEVIVNGQPVIVKSGTVRDVISQAVRLSGQIGAPIAQWELRTTEGDVIPHGLCDGTDYVLTPGRRLWLNLGLPVPPASAEAAPVERPDGVSLIAAERRRQIDVEGWTPKHDDSHKDGILAAAAACLAAEGTDGEFTWPAYELSWIKSLRDRHVRDRQRQLVIAGALIAAEIDRLQRFPALPPSTERTP